MKRREFMKAVLAGTLRAVLPGAPLVLAGPVAEVPHWDGVADVLGLTRGRQFMLSTPMGAPGVFYEMVKRASQHLPDELAPPVRGVTSVLDGVWENG